MSDSQPKLVLVASPPGRVCSQCQSEGPFNKDDHRWCKACRNKENVAYRAEHRDELRVYSKAWRIDNAVKMLLRNAKKRAEKKGLPFDLVASDIVIPSYCPVLGIRLAPCSGIMHPNNPTIDRFVDANGYVRGNIAVISWRANCLKRDATIRELQAVIAWMRATERMKGL